MRTCPKCGSYLPDGKLLCPACNRPVVGAAGDHRQRTAQEKNRTHSRISESMKTVKRDTWTAGERTHPYSGNTYEQHKSHDPRSKDYYRSKHEPSSSDLSPQAQRVVCAAAYFGILFFLPLVLMPNSKEGRFHANQGLLVFIVNLIVGSVANILAISITDFFEIFAAIPPILMVYGASNAYKGNMTELPVIGKIRLIGDDNQHYTNLGGRR